jgi:hypothetical protein
MFGRQPWRHQQQGTRKHIKDNHLQATLRGPIDNLGAHEKQQRKYAKEAAKEKAEKDAKTAAYMKEFTELNTKAHEDFAKANHEYDVAFHAYNEYLKDPENPKYYPKRKNVPKKPKKPEFKDPVVPNAKERFGVHGGRRRTRRGRKSRSTRRR